MSFKVTIEVQNKDLGPLLAQLPKCKYELKHTVDFATSPVKNGKPKKGKSARAVAASTLKMTGNTPKMSKLLAAGLDLFERMEAEHGVGSVTVEMFRNQVDANELSNGNKLQTRLLHEGYLEYLN